MEHIFFPRTDLCGIGVTFDRCHINGTWRIDKILDHVDANEATCSDPNQAKSSITPGDEVVEVNSVPVTDMSPQDLGELIMGPEGTSVKLTIRRKLASPTPEFQEDITGSPVKESQLEAKSTDSVNIPIVARRARRQKSFELPMSASAEGLKAVFQLLGGQSPMHSPLAAARPEAKPSVA
mmetsp:Transcript_68457/g.182616  ORF Transcript_68457/g.182616 Transcript_68457/m.182616 type:complete len:180 (-) Transcript_68457:371-910(-)